MMHMNAVLILINTGLAALAVSCELAAGGFDLCGWWYEAGTSHVGVPSDVRAVPHPSPARRSLSY